MYVLFVFQSYSRNSIKEANTHALSLKPNLTLKKAVTIFSKCKRSKNVLKIKLLETIFFVTYRPKFLLYRSDFNQSDSVIVDLLGRAGRHCEP